VTKVKGTSIQDVLEVGLEITIEATSGGSSSADSSKENKDSSQIESEKSNSGADVEIASAVSQNAASPAASIPPWFTSLEVAWKSIFVI